MALGRSPLRPAALALAAGALVLIGCTTQETRVHENEPQGFAAWSEQPTIHTLGAGDRVKFDFPLTPENDEDVLVGADGYIGLRIAGRIRAQGLTVNELQEEVTKAASTRLKNPIVVAGLSDSRSSRVVVGGQVQHPGVYLIGSGLTVFEAVMLAGGVNPESRMNEVVLMRLRPNNTAMLRKINLQNFISKGDTTQNPQIQAEDMIFVPRSRVAEVNWWIEEYINRDVPFGRSVNYDYSNNVTPPATTAP
jgi:protein involved in polysaccharide export with SLBB domain